MSKITYRRFSLSPARKAEKEKQHLLQHLYDEWLTKLSEKAAHLSGLFPNIVVQEGAVEKPLRDYSVSEQAAILCAYGDLTEDDEGEEFPEE